VTNERASGQALWAAAQSLPELGEAMAQWLEGRITYQPAYSGAEPEEETAELVPVLAAYNRSGFVTDFSQPAVSLDEGYGCAQRAAVCGFCDEATARRLLALTLRTGLIVLAHDPLLLEGIQIPVTVDVEDEDVEASTWVGAFSNSEAIAHYYSADCPPAAVRALQTAWQVHIVDPVWGRNDLLSDEVRAVLAEAWEG
jgi:hypothetical protein